MSADCAPRELIAEPVTSTADALGEGLHWDATRRRMIRVDLYAGLVHALDVVSGSEETFEAGGPVSFAIPRAGGGYVLGCGLDVVVIDPDGARRVLFRLADELATSRINDGKCDARGRLWFGTLSRIRQRGACGVYRLEPDGSCDRVLDGITMGNGLGWSPTWETMFYIDSTKRSVDAFDFDLAAGRIDNRRTLARIDAASGMPDGITVDEDAGVWVALYGGGCLHRYSDDGLLDSIVRVPVPTPTTAGFGGIGLDDLYITTSRHRLAPTTLAAMPQAGALFMVRPGQRGFAPAEFLG